LIAALHRLWPGSALAVVIALAATAVSTLHGGPQLLYALFFGISFHYLSHEPRTKAGIDFCARTVLRLGVGLLGARITLAQLGELGAASAGAVALGVAATIAFGWWLAPRLALTRHQGLLSGGSVAICGASAALAIAAVLPREKDGERFTLVVVVSVTALSTLAMVLYPLLARTLELSPHWAGMFLGGTIHDVAQVVGAGYTLGPATGDIATIFKLLRVSLLTLVVLALSVAFRQARDTAQQAPQGAPPSAERAALVPWFLWVFVGAVLLNSAGAIAPEVSAALGHASRACLVVAIAALGIKTSFMQLARAGWRPFVLIVAETLFLALLVLAAIAWLRAQSPA
jgi:uncharacterized integral membrane protein (TIGR00698 family)